MTLQWRRSSYTGGANDDRCVEVARLASGIAVRDSKHPERGHLELSAGAFAGLLTLARRRMRDPE
jgi:hypothetical protein